MSIFAKSPETNGGSPDNLRKDISSSRLRSHTESSSEVSIVGPGVRIEGDIHVGGDVRVGGRINGAVYVKDRIVLASDGAILGGIQAGEGDLAGTVEGDVVIAGRLTIRKTASITGLITAQTLIVEEGAAVSGTCKVGKPNRVRNDTAEIGDGAEAGMSTLLSLE